MFPVFVRDSYGHSAHPCFWSLAFTANKNLKFQSSNRPFIWKLWYTSILTSNDSRLLKIESPVVIPSGIDLAIVNHQLQATPDRICYIWTLIIASRQVADLWKYGEIRFRLYCRTDVTVFLNVWARSPHSSSHHTTDLCLHSDVVRVMWRKVFEDISSSLVNSW